MSSSRSHKSTSSFVTKSIASRSSSKSKFAAEAAALRAKLKYLDAESKARLELERIQTQRDIEIAEAALKSYEDDHYSAKKEIDLSSDLENIQNRNEYVRDYINQMPDAETLSLLPQTTVPPTRQFDIPPGSAPSSVQNSSSSQQQSDIVNLAQTLVDQMNLTKLPIPEPPLFKGNILQYPAWKNTFNTLIERKSIPDQEKLFYLKRYLDGDAKDSVESYFLLDCADAYHDAKAYLEKLYGDPFKIAQAFRDKLENWPRIYPRDGAALRKLSDFLRQCQTAMISNKSLSVLNDPRENRKLLCKLPESIYSRWAVKVHDYKTQHQDFPPFQEFVRFITRESDIACDPVTSQIFKPLNTSQGHSSGYFNNANSHRRSNGFKSFQDRKTPSATSLATGGTDTSNKSSGFIQQCALCKGRHHLNECPKFLEKTIPEKKRYIEENRLCYACMFPGHLSKHCRQRLFCSVCSKRHPTSLHGDTLPSNEREQAVSHNAKVNSIEDKSSMIVPVWLSHVDNPEHEKLTYLLQDSQSDTSFCTNNSANELDVNGKPAHLMLSTMSAENQLIDCRKISGLQVRAYNSDPASKRISLPPVFTRDRIPINRSHIPTPEMARKWPHLSKIASDIPPLMDCEVGLLIGYDCPKALTPREVIPHDNTGPFALKTDLGWGIVGVVSGLPDESEFDAIGSSSQVFSCSTDAAEVRFSLRNKVKELINPAEVLKMMEMDFSERSFEGSGISRDDQQFLDKMNSSIRMVEEHYEMPLPFRSERPFLPNNRQAAVSRLNLLTKRFQRNVEFKTDYSTFMDEIITNGYAELVPEDEIHCDNGHIWYIPHHGVYNVNKPGKIRVVFDCSYTLNDHLLKGPDLTNSLFGVLCRFRSRKIAFVCDIEKMFFQFKVTPVDRDYLRFLWWKDDKITDYRMSAHLFGAASSPGCANYGLKRAANDFEDEFGSCIADFVRNNFYVDDGLLSVDTEWEAIEIVDKSKKLLAKCGLRLHKFVSNSKKVLQEIPVQDRASTVQSLELFSDELPVERCLGVQWCVQSDTFQFRISLKDQPLTRRGILSTVSSIYDPLGLISPVILVGKQILQELCRNQTDWDAEIPEELRTRWEAWRSNLIDLEKLKIDRCFKPKDFGEVQIAELHHFSDASTYGYGQCSYLRLVDENNKVSCSLVMSKSRVTPLKPITIPRLELSAALVSVKVSNQLRAELDYENVIESYWTDSKVVLGYINNDARRFHTFVANRISQVRDSTEPNQWYYVKSSENPADIASRGVTAHELLNSKWFSGPDFIWKPTIQASEEQIGTTVHGDDPEVKHVTSLATHTQKTQKTFELSRLSHISDWFHAKRSIALCLKLKDYLRRRLQTKDLKEPVYGPLSVEDLRKAELEIIRLVQAEAFGDEIKLIQESTRSTDGSVTKCLKRSSRLFKLDPFMDSNGILCVGGRLKISGYDVMDKHPMILPKKNHITDCIVRYFHELAEHQGRGITTNFIRSNGFWIIGCSRLVSSCILRCVTCRKLRGRLQGQKMSELPKDRIQEAPPFTYCGADCFGPWYIKQGRKEIKRYGLLFVCMSSRAVHIETLDNLSTDSFINGLRRFQCLRGPIRQLRCDNGTNFVGASRELTESLKNLDNKYIQKYLLENGCDYFEFCFNVPTASHMGGVWERQIRTIRSVLSSIIHKTGSQLDDESLRTFMHEAAAIINSRPLTVDNLNDPQSLSPLTPNHILTMKSRIVLPPPGQFLQQDVYSRKRWRRVQYVSNQFWNRWRLEYLHNLQQRSKWIKPCRDMCDGDIVLIVDDNLSRNNWALARIIEIIRDGDNHVRKVKVVLGDSKLDSNGKRVQKQTILERPIHKLVLVLETGGSPSRSHF